MRFLYMTLIVCLAGCSKSKEAPQAPVADAPATPGNTAAPSGEKNASAPVEAVSIAPENPVHGEALTAKITDAQNRLVYFVWLINGEEVAGQHQDRLPGEYVNKGAKIKVSATPKTDDVDGAQLTSNEVTVLNTRPQVASLDLVSSSGDKVVLQTKAEDVDGDKLVYRLISGPAGMTIDAGGQIQWALPSDFAQAVTFSVGVSDGEAETIHDGSVGSK
jgi:hypothetical protein